MASFLSSALGLAKLGSNILSGGSGKTTTTSSSQNTSMKTTGQTAASRQEYSDGFLKVLEQAAAGALANTADSQGALGTQRDKVVAANLGGKPAMAFDADSYIRDMVAGASDSINNDVRANVNAIAANTGGSSSGNSAAALLENRLRTEGAAKIAGVKAEATGSAAQIASSLREQQVNELSAGTGQISSLVSAGDAGLTTLLNALRGGETYQEVNNNETQTGTSSGTAKEKTPFNWTAGLGNLFKDIGQD